MGDNAKSIGTIMGDSNPVERLQKYKPELRGKPEEFTEAFTFWLAADKFSRMDPRTRHDLTEYLTRLFSGVEHKGLLCAGATGTFKTAFLRELHCLRGGWFKTAKDAKWKYCEDPHGFDRIVKGDRSLQRVPRELYIDDIGAETPLVDFGNYTDVIADLVDVRYDQWLYNGYLAHFTTNLTMKELEDRYDSRLVSRLSEMCVLVAFDGKDRRLEG